jgi:hypothetical protein
VTGEGEYTVLTQQTSRYLLKLFNSPTAATSADTAYLKSTVMNEKCTVTHSKQFFESSVQLHAYTHRAARLTKQIAAQIAADVAAGNQADSHSPLMEVL